MSVDFDAYVRHGQLNNWLSHTFARRTERGNDHYKFASYACYPRYSTRILFTAATVAFTCASIGASVEDGEEASSNHHAVQKIRHKLILRMLAQLLR